MLSRSRVDGARPSPDRVLAIPPDRRLCSSAAVAAAVTALLTGLLTGLRRLRIGSLHQKVACSGWRKGHVACGEKHDQREGPRKDWHRILLNSQVPSTPEKSARGIMMP